MGWSEERVGILKKLWLEGLSASQIAKQLGGTSRNAVIGKIHRLGLSERAEPSRPTFKTPRPPRPAVSSSSAPRRGYRGNSSHADSVPVGTQLVCLTEEEPGLATIHTLGAHMCKWPIGDPAADDFSFCGKRCEGTYCLGHASVAYRSQQQTPGRPPATLAQLERSLRRYI